MSSERALPPEVHLFVLWEHARPWADRIIADVERTFRILDAIELRWTAERAPRHFSRLYGQPLSAGSPKLVDCGTGPPLILVVSDARPHYGRRRKWGETSTVNTHLFDAKRRYRARAGGSRVHDTTDLSETEHDLFLLLGLRSADYADRPRIAWDRVVRPVERDPTGDRAWSSMQELMTAIDLTVSYVVLPPVDGGASLRLLTTGLCDHCGLEWLVSDPDRYPEAAASRVYPVVVGEHTIGVEIRRLGDGAHPRAWQRAMLERRRRDASGTFVLDPDDALLELTHALLARGRVPTPGDLRRLDKLASAAGRPAPPIEDRTAAGTWLEAAIAARGDGPDAAEGDGRRPGPLAALAEGAETAAVIAAGIVRDGFDRLARSVEDVVARRRAPGSDQAGVD